LRGSRIEDYDTPLVVAWQLTNRCSAACLACCEDSGRDRVWRDELTRAEALDLAQRLVTAEVPYVAFGGGEPLGVPHCWELFEILAASGVGIKLETNAEFIDDAAADRLAALPIQCVQISVDGAGAKTHERMRPGSSFTATLSAIERLVARGVPPQWVFVPTRLNVDEIIAAYDLAAQLGCEAFVTGPLMRLGRAAADWENLACKPDDWERAVTSLQEHAAVTGEAMRTAVYPWDILTEIERRLESPQAMLLVVPNGKVKLMNALPFAVASFREHTVSRAWEAYRNAWRSAEVSTFIEHCRVSPSLLGHANETWPLGELMPWRPGPAHAAHE